MIGMRMGHHLFTLPVSLLLLYPVESLKIDGLAVPATVLTGDRVRFTCSFKLEGVTLHTLTWLKNEEPFFRCRFGEASDNNDTLAGEELASVSSRLEEPKLHKITYNLEGITVDVQGSTMNEVWLSRVDHRASGVITCRVVGLNFRITDERSSNLTVIDVPAEAPEIEGKTTGYILDQLLHLNCSSPPAHPPLLLFWKINSKPVRNLSLALY
ncbi:Immunoglobulin-like domain [Trinorchestia longiramus]|nr:Immunoglobulin-like domain [Trinorchestia longiramus]